jgi:hypothetical protein
MNVARILVWTKINSLVNRVSNVKIDSEVFSIKIVEDGESPTISNNGKINVENLIEAYGMWLRIVCPYNWCK